MSMRLAASSISNWGSADFGGGEDVAVFKRENGPKGIDLKRKSFIGIGTNDFQRAHLVALAFFDWNCDIDGFSVAAAGDGNTHAKPNSVDIFEDRIAANCLEVAIILVEAAAANL